MSIYRRQTFRKHPDSVYTTKPVIHTRLKKRKPNVTIRKTSGHTKQKRAMTKKKSYCIDCTLFLSDVKKVFSRFYPLRKHVSSGI